MAKRTRHYKEGQILYLAYPDEVQKIEIVGRGDGGYVFKRKKKDPYVVRNIGGDEDGDEYVISSEKFHEDPLAAAIASDELGLEDNPIEDDEDEEGEGEDDDEEEDEEDDDEADDE